MESLIGWPRTRWTAPPAEPEQMVSYFESLVQAIHDLIEEIEQFIKVWFRSVVGDWFPG